MADGITRIAVEGFKSISKKQSIDIAPLTILAGANSSGKSSIMQPLLMLKQTLESTFDPGPLWIGGPNVKFTSTDQFLSRNSSQGTNLSIEIALGNAEFDITFEKNAMGIQILEERAVLGLSNNTLRPEMTPEEIAAQLGLPHRRDLNVVRNRFFLIFKGSGIGSIDMTSWADPFLRNTVHVPGLRGNPSRTYPATAVGTSFPGTFEYYVASVIAHWQFEQNRNVDVLNDDLRRLGLANRVLARRLNEAEIDLQVTLSGRADDMVSIADVGFGVSQTLPVLVALLAANRSELVYLEEPEIHLHPRAQVRLAAVLADAAKRGVRVVAETHSTLLLTAIQTLVAKGELKPELVKLHWFQRDPKTGVTEVTSTDLDENGAFVQSDWPEDFDDVILKADGAYLDAVESRQAR
jgi:predicted ATPase